MGYGDEIMASGLARGAWSRGKRVAFGDGQRIIWGPWSKEIFLNNKNIAPPGSEGSSDLEWVDFYKGNRTYNRLGDNRWIWNMKFRPVPGEIFFSASEIGRSQRVAPGFILVEPNVPNQKSVAVNKQWPIGRWQNVTDILFANSYRVVQLRYPGAKYFLKHAEIIDTDNFRDALAILSRSILFLGHEGGMHHAAAALEVPAVVIFGGFIPPQVTGYPLHMNLTGENTIACGSLSKCDHCQRCLEAIAPEEVLYHASSILSKQELVHG